MRSTTMLHRGLSRLHRDESGVAMVIAMMVVFVVVLLSIVIFDMSIHNTDQAAYDRKRVTSIAAAEAGIDRGWNLIQFTAPGSLPCGTSVSDALGSQPAPATFSISFTWYRPGSSGAPEPYPSGTCPSQQVPPTAALITSVGETNTSVPRTMQTYVTLSPNYGGFGSAILAVNNTTFNNNFGILGQSGNDGNIYVTNGNLVINNAVSVYGNVYVHNGTAFMKNNAQINGELWANGEITLNSPSTVGTNVISSTGAIDTTSDPGGTVGGFAMAGTTVEEPPLAISGSTYEYSPQGAPPTQAFPKLCQVALSGVCPAMPWTGYTLTTATTCAAAQTFLDASLSGDQVLWIPSGCADLVIANNDVINFSGNLAIVTNGKVTMENRNNWNGVTGKKLFFISNYRTGLSCSSGAYNITTGNNSDFKNASVLFYSPCTVSLNNQNDFTGQVLGSTVEILNHFTMQYQPVLVPGLDSIEGFNQNVVYIREVAN